MIALVKAGERLSQPGGTRALKRNNMLFLDSRRCDAVMRLTGSYVTERAGGTGQLQVHRKIKRA
jgi:hypothetical protein